MERMLDVLKWSVIVGGAAALLTLLKPLLDRRYSPRWRYGVWLVMAALLLLAPVQQLVPRLELAQPPVVIRVPQVELSVSREEGISLQRPAPAAQAVKGAGSSVRAPEAGRTLQLDALLPRVWLAGGAAYALYRLLGTAAFVRRARRWSRGAGEETQRLYGQVCREMGIKKAPVLRISSAVDSPMMAGLLRPCLLLPHEAYQDWELPFILRHELTHYRRRDLWYKLLLLAACTVHWFNPLVHLLRREAEADLELTCDGLVVAGADEETRRAYSETLLAAVRRQRGLSRWALSTHFYGGAEVMKERFRNILGKRGRKWGAAALALTLVATLAAACSFGIRQEGSSALSDQELAQWQEKMESPEMDRYIYRMYTDVSLLPTEEKLNEIFPTPEGMEDLGHEDVNPRVLSGTRDGDTVTLEIEGNFASRQPSGTMTLVDGEPVRFTTPLYTAAETAARAHMDRYAETIASYTDDPPVFVEKQITNLFCAESVSVDGKTYYVWNLYYGLRPDDIRKVMFAGGMGGENGWVSQSSSMGDPVLILSVDGSGGIALEAETWTSTVSEESFTWEEYVVCGVHLEMGMGGILNGWPAISTPFLESMRDGHETWAMDWQDVAISYLEETYGVYADSGFTSLRTFTADIGENCHDQALLVRGICGERTVTLLLAHVRYDVPVWDTAMTFWQVCGVKWEPDAPPQTAPQPEEPAPRPGEQEDALSPDELATLTSHFNSARYNGLLRFPYESYRDAGPYLQLLLYDAGEPVTDEEERSAAAELFGGTLETDCTKVTRAYLTAYLAENFSAPEGTNWLDLGVDLAEVLGPYLEEYDAYYMVHGDAMLANYAFTGGTRAEDGTVWLYYTTDLWQFNGAGELELLWDQPMSAHLRPDGNGGVLMISNTPAAEM